MEKTTKECARQGVKALDELQEIARVHTRAALEAHERGSVRDEEITLGVMWDGEYRVFELYVPAERPEDARVISRARVHEVTGAVELEVFLPRKQTQGTRSGADPI